jgi:glycosyltransferase involved in cell wall biosynthesis
MPPRWWPSAPASSRPDWEVVREGFPRLRPDVPIVTFVGRNDAEKGIDLLLYAARMLRQKGLTFQLAIAGGTTFGSRYRQACEELAGHLRLDVHWHGQIQPEARDALYAVSHCVVYPPVHREPFGMVAAEALSQGTPVVVPDHGGLTEAIRHDGRVAGLTFRVWDTGDLAAQIERLLVDGALHAKLAASAPPVAKGFDVGAMADRLLAHLDLPPRPVTAGCTERVVPVAQPMLEEAATSALL